MLLGKIKIYACDSCSEIGIVSDENKLPADWSNVADKITGKIIKHRCKKCNDIIKKKIKEKLK